MSKELDVRSVARSHIGELRKTNEDRVLNCVERCLWAVADGMGGHNMGDVAAEIVISSLTEMAAKARTLSLASIDDALNLANARVLALDDQTKNRPGSTVAGLCLVENSALIFWAGDSRVYRRRDGRVQLLTHDHRAVQELVDAGLIDPGQARSHPKAAIITRAVGATPGLSLASRIEQVHPDDTYLLCSDGLSDMVEADEIERALTLDNSGAADRLVHSALAAGGSDNISVILVSVKAICLSTAETDLRTRAG